MADYNQDSKDRNGKFQPLVEYCVDLFEKIEKSDYRKAKIQEIKDSRKTYEQIETTASFPWSDASNIVMPFTTITVDNLEPRIVAAITGKEPYVQFEMEGLTAQDEQTKILQDWWHSEMKNVMGFEDVAREIAHTLLLEGTVYPIPKYDTDDIVRRDFQFDEKGEIILKEDGTPTITEREDNVFEGGIVDYVEYNDMYVPDDATDWEKTEFIRAVRPTYGELMRLKDDPGYMNIGEWLCKEKSENLDEESQSASQDISDVKITGKETVECLECHIGWVHREEDEKDEDIKDWTEERVIALIAKESKTLIRYILRREINFKNEQLIKRLRIYSERGKSSGTCLYGKLKSIQKGGSDIFNSVINLATITMIPWFIYGDKAGLDSDIELKPGQGIKADDPTQVVFPKFQIQPQYFIEFINLFVSLWERIGSIGDLQLGRTQETKSKTTATEVLAVIQEGNIKHNYQSKVFFSELLSLVQTLYDLYYQNMSLQKTFSYQGEDVPISRAFMRRPWKFRLTGSTDLANKIIERKENEDFYALLSNNPLANHIEVLQDLVKTYKPGADPKKYIDPTIAKLYQAFQENPELIQVVEKYLQDKAEIQEEIAENAENDRMAA